ncbi:TetR/AcrR family transcriptional regulator [Rhodoplanes roseus]|uniref:HTH tetR-type domain-containing protein n=1 Tax=Rhodoplanes roseus TaxID=29409 RepID=A0A327KQ13_9BRAD|nr:TetR/AcrR family transcriptional regulator [Rhodoplanes roseus]RAI40959.1 hypothetical protein CH341_22740 [Rhodoplanes roseus]
MRRTKEEAGQTRERILAVGERLFRAKGIAAVSVEEIAEAAGFTRGAVHWHFHDKRGLLLALADRRGLPLQRLADRVKVDPDLEPLDEFQAVIVRAFGDMEQGSADRQFETTLAAFAAAEAPDRLRRFEADLRQAITTIFEAAEGGRRLKPEWPAATAGLACYGLLSGLVNAWLRGEAGFSLTTDVVGALRAFIAAVSRPNPGG